MKIDYYHNKEIELTENFFNLKEILNFQLEHDIQIIRGEGY
ncbi:MAG TPA: hypothetical protein PLN85_00475 [archaeon]|nr:hypothetical protein [archaeon]